MKMKQLIKLSLVALAFTGLGFICLTAHAQTNCTAPPSGMVAWYPGDGNANDIVGGNNGSPQGSVTFAPGEVAQAFSFNGSSFETMGNPAALNITGNQITIDGWINPTAHNITPSNGEIYFGKTQFGSNDYLLLFDVGVLSGLINAGGSELEIQSTFTPPLNQWSHIALVYDGATATGYANGLVVRTSIT